MHSDQRKVILCVAGDHNRALEIVQVHNSIPDRDSGFRVDVAKFHVGSDGISRPWCLPIMCYG